MNEQMARNLLGTDQFTELLINLPDAFYYLPETTQEAFFKALMGKINEGVIDLARLIRFADAWLAIYREIKQAVRR